MNMGGTRGGLRELDTQGPLRVPSMFTFNMSTKTGLLSHPCSSFAGVRDSDLGACSGARECLFLRRRCLYHVLGAVNVGEGGQRHADMGGTRGAQCI